MCQLLLSRLLSSDFVNILTVYTDLYQSLGHVECYIKSFCFNFF